jgi:hypothetical protein
LFKSKEKVMTTPIVARCTCGSFQFQSTRAPILQLTCHCEHCRQVAKLPFTNFAFFKLAEAAMTGQTVSHSFTADSGSKTVRETCATCGDLVVDRTEGFPQLVGVVAERILPPFEFTPRCHVWSQSKAADVAIPDGVKAFDRGMQ